ncbi:RNA dependent RNA polymerase [Rhodotorula paludigena]|uniref:RNA dependent RNA polymerase n=1 Tax=Rhodotorula paludigena TaxID=86838 RepID=UPI003170C12A
MRTAEARDVLSPVSLLDSDNEQVAAPPSTLRAALELEDVDEMGRRPFLHRVSTAYQSQGVFSAPQTAESNQDSSVGIRSLAFGIFPSSSSFSGEWEREGRGVDKLLVEKRQKDNKVLLVARMWDEAGPASLSAGTASSIRVTIEASTIDHCRSAPGGTSLYLSLSRPPTFEILPARPPGSLKPQARQVPAFDEAHAQVAGYASCALRIKLRSRVEFVAFVEHAERAGLPRIVNENVALESSLRFGATTLALLASWLLTLDFRIAFQLEKLVRNGLIGAAKVFGLRVRVDELILERDVRETERVLAFFADRLAMLEPGGEGGDTTDEKKAASSSQATVTAARRQRRKTDTAVLVLDGETSGAPRKQRRKTDSFIVTLDSDDDDQRVEDDDDDVLVVGASLPYFRGIASRHPAQLSLSDLLLLLDRAVSESAVLGQLLADAEESQLVRQVTLTPTRTLLSGPVLCDTNTVIRSYAHPQNFLTIAVRHEDGARLTDRDEHILNSRFKHVFRDGFDLGGRSFQFLAWSSSGLKSGSCFFVSTFQHEGQLVTPASIHKGIGDFRGTETALIPAKYMARIGQAFSSSKPTLKLDASQIILIPDVASPSGSCFSDGVGLISTALAADVVAALGLKVNAQQSAPTCFQFRMGGAKGMLQVDPSLQDKVVAVRPSQVKFKSELTHLEIAGTFDAGPAFLNLPLIKLLEDLGVPSARYLDLQSAATRKIRKSRSTLRSAIKLVQDYSLAPGTGFSSTLAFLATSADTASAAFLNPFVSRCLDASVTHALRDIKHSGRIPLPGCYNLVGVLDIDGCLAADEVYARISRADGSQEYLSGTIAISRSPTNHPGDCRLVKAVGKLPKGAGERIRGLTNCVVFSCHGYRSLPSMLAGGDLDGDVYLLLTAESGLVPAAEKIAAPAAYDPSPTVKLDHEVTVADGGDFFFQYITQDRTGLVATRQLHLADVYPEGLYHPDCLKLAQLHSDCVDSAKSGTFVPATAIPRVPPRGWPDFLANDSPDSYRSPKALGQLYRAIGEEAFSSAADASLTTGNPLTALDPLRSLTDSLANLSIPYLSASRLPHPVRNLVEHFRAYLASFSSELSKLLSLGGTSQRGTGATTGLEEEALFLSVSLGVRRLRKDDKLATSRRREQAGELFALVRRLIRQRPDKRNGSAEEAVVHAWAAWHAAVEESEDRAKAAVVRGKRRASGTSVSAEAQGEGRGIGLRTWGWLALGVLVEQLQAVEREKVEVITID